MLEIMVFEVGVCTLVFGQVRFPRNLNPQGQRARGAALFLIMPLPLTIQMGK
jgi:hypothetical protein